MAITRLDVHGFRNLGNQRLNFARTRNVIVGENGSGKSSLLEAVSALLSGKSFRGARPEHMVRHGAPEYSLFGQVQVDERNVRQVGLKRQLREKQVILQVDQRPAATLSEVVALQPVTSIDPGSLELFAGPSVRRRQLLDWGVFHVEHCDPGMWGRYNRALEQRNQLLRSGKISRSVLQPWDAELSRQAEAITEHRRRYLDRLATVFQSVIQTLSEQELSLSLALQEGWDTALPLADALEAQLSVDSRQGFTSLGPHRADLKLQVGGRKASAVLSRGQTKVAVVSLKLAQGMLVDQVRHGHVLYLIDDLFSELDSRFRLGIGRMLSGFANQVLFTCIEAPTEEMDALVGAAGATDVKMFHVEHGTIRETA